MGGDPWLSRAWFVNGRRPSAEQLLASAVIKLAVADATRPSVRAGVRQDAVEFLSSPELDYWITVAGLDVRSVRERIARVLDNGHARRT